MLEYMILIFAIPLGFILANVTQKEKSIYSKKRYFYSILFGLAFLSSVFYFIDRQIALTTTFIFITTFVWYKA